MLAKTITAHGNACQCLTFFDFFLYQPFPLATFKIHNFSIYSCLKNLGELYLFSPSDTTFVKHFIGRFGSTNVSPQNYDNHFAGYGNTTSAVNAIDFKFSSGNIDSGVIKMYGIA